LIVEVKLLGTLRKYSPPDTAGKVKLDVPSGSTVSDVAHRIVSSRAPVVACAVNGHTRKLNTVVNEGDEVILLSKLGGG
jgi:molybdopterin converting factor small subunit